MGKSGVRGSGKGHTAAKRVRPAPVAAAVNNRIVLLFELLASGALLKRRVRRQRDAPTSLSLTTISGRLTRDTSDLIMSLCDVRSQPVLMSSNDLHVRSPSVARCQWPPPSPVLVPALLCLLSATDSPS